MESGSSSGAALLIFFLIIQVVITIALLVGGMYLLYCFQRAAAGLDRLASVAELWLERQNQLDLEAKRRAQAVPVPQNSPINDETHA